MAKLGHDSAGFAPSPSGGRLGWGPAAAALGTLLNQGKGLWICPPPSGRATVFKVKRF